MEIPKIQNILWINQKSNLANRLFFSRYYSIKYSDNFLSMKFLENKTPDFIKTKILILIGMENTSSTQLIMIKVVDKTNKIFEIHFVLATVINIM